MSGPDRRLAGYCGLYCGACDIYRLAARARAEDRTPAWDELPAELRALPRKPSPIRCEGCRGEEVFAGCAWCPIRRCAKGRGLAGFCTDCESYPCLRLRVFGLFAWILRFERKLPHLKVKRDNLARAKCAGMDAWLAEQAEEWRCPECRTVTSWYQRTCTKCGHAVTPRFRG